MTENSGGPDKSTGSVVQKAAVLAGEENSGEPIRRGERARRRICKAAIHVLADKGMPGFTMEAIARQAGASKATLYRHWPSTSVLLVEAMNVEFRPFPHVDSGDLRADLISQLTAFTRMLADSDFPKLMAAFVDAAEREPSLADLHAELTDRRRAPLVHLVEVAIARGEIPSDTDAELVVDLLAGPFFYRRFIAHRTIPIDMPVAVVDQVLASVFSRSGGLHE